MKPVKRFIHNTYGIDEYTTVYYIVFDRMGKFGYSKIADKPSALNTIEKYLFSKSLNLDGYNWYLEKIEEYYE